MDHWLNRVRRQKVGVRLGLMTLCLAVAGAAVAPIAWASRGALGLGVACLAAGICWAGASTALVGSSFFRGPGQFLWGLLVAMAARTGIPLVLGMVVAARGGPLVESGFVYYFLGFYLLMLTVETALSLPATDGPPAAPNSAGNGDSWRR